jgi:hypothetical protein
MLASMDDVATVKDLTRELAYDDGGRAVRAALRKGFPDYLKNDRWDPLSPAQVGYVRRSVSPKR